MNARSKSVIAVLAVLVWALGCGGMQQTADTPQNRRAGAEELAAMFVQSGSWERTMSEGADLGRDATLDELKLQLGRELTTEEQDRVREIMYGALSETLTAEMWEQMLTDICAEYFTAAELGSILAFFESSAGSKILELTSKLDREIEVRSDTAFEERVDQFIERVDAELSSVFPELSEGATP